LGLARLNHGAEGPAGGNDVTMAGGVIGTADYMPPEQAVDSTTIDHRADVYSLACTLHYLLTGKPPYSGSTIMAILLKHRDGEIPTLQSLRPETPAELDELFRRMLAKRPEDRVQQMSEVVAELEGIASQLTSREAPQSRLGATIDLSAAEWSASLGTLAGPTSSTAQSAGATVAMDANAGPTTVLIVEPSRVQASIIKGYLQEQLIEVAGAAASGKDAIEMVRKLQPRAVLSAMYLPDMSGIELAQRIRSEHKASPPGFVLITSEADDAESASLSKLNRVLMLPKPFTAAQLADALNLVIGGTAATSSSNGPRKKPRKELRVLIVDDSTPARIQVRTVLQGLGFSQFLEVPDGAHAIAAASRENCDLIVTDYNMPLMDGRALVSYLKQNPATAAVPIVMVTTETEPRVLDPVRRLGVAAIVEKAFPASVVGPLLDSLF
jgi:two-component system chemotaxis response regulator CheY